MVRAWYARFPFREALIVATAPADAWATRGPPAFATISPANSLDNIRAYPPNADFAIYASAPCASRLQITALYPLTRAILAIPQALAHSPNTAVRSQPVPNANLVFGSKTFNINHETRALASGVRAASRDGFENLQWAFVGIADQSSTGNAEFLAKFIAGTLEDAVKIVVDALLLDTVRNIQSCATFVLTDDEFLDWLGGQYHMNPYTAEPGTLLKHAWEACQGVIIDLAITAATAGGGKVLKVLKKTPAGEAVEKGLHEGADKLKSAAGAGTRRLGAKAGPSADTLKKSLDNSLDAAREKSSDEVSQALLDPDRLVQAMHRAPEGSKLYQLIFKNGENPLFHEAYEKAYQKVTACVLGNSFAPGTQVMTGRGLQPIQALTAKDTVAGLRTGTAKTFWPVARAWAATGEPLVQLAYWPLGRKRPPTAATGKPPALRLTPGHEVWSVSAGAWRAAAQLQPGERLRLFDGGEAVVARVRPEAAGPRGPPPVYDLHVPGAHAFFALPQGQQHPGLAVWVHNGGCSPWLEGAIPRGLIIEDIRVRALGLAGRLFPFQRVIDWFDGAAGRILSIKSVNLKKSYQGEKGLKSLASTMKNHFKKLDDFARGAKEETIRFVNDENVKLVESQVKSRELHYGIEDIKDSSRLLEAMDRMVKSLIFEERLPANAALKNLSDEPHAYRVGDIIIRIFEVK